MLVRLVFAGLLLAHALIHFAFVAPAPPATAGGPAWPFSTSDSWLFTRLGAGQDKTRTVALALIATTIAGFSLAGLTVIGALPTAIWPPGIAIGAASSIALLIAFFHPWLVLAIGIDLVPDLGPQLVARRLGPADPGLTSMQPQGGLDEDRFPSPCPSPCPSRRR